MIYIGIGVIISFLIPFPISFVVYLLIFLVLNVIRTDLNLRKSGMKDGIRGLYRSVSSGFGSNGISKNVYHNAIKFLCMNCGKEHKRRACPRCGSTAVRAAQKILLTTKFAVNTISTLVSFVCALSPLSFQYPSTITNRTITCHLLTS